MTGKEFRLLRNGGRHIPGRPLRTHGDRWRVVFYSRGRSVLLWVDKREFVYTHDKTTGNRNFSVSKAIADRIETAVQEAAS